MKINKFFSITLTLLFAGTLCLSAQTFDNVVSKFNAAAEIVNTDAARAATLLYEVIEMSEKVGPEADEIRMMAETQIPAVYFRWGADQQRDGNTEKAIEVFEKSIEYGEKYNDANTVSRAQGVLGRLYLAQGNTAYRAGENETAIEMLNKSLEFDPENARTFLLLGLSHRRLEDVDAMMVAMDKAIELAKLTDDAQTQGTAEKSMRDYLAIRANRSIQGNRPSEAIGYLNKAISYGEEAQTYFMLTLAHNSLKQWDNAIAAAEKALQLEVDDPNEKAKIWFEMGNAYREKGSTNDACRAFRNAAVGAFTESANYQVQHVLKCN